MADWKKIKTEYITTDISYRKLGEKYGVNYQTICARSKSEGWILLREQYQNKTIAKTIENLSDKEAKKAAKVSDLADKLLIKLEQAIEELDLQVTTHKIKTERANTEETTEFRVAVPGGVVDRAGLRQLTGALKELKIIKEEISDLERREREARIDALNRSGTTADGEDDDTGVILLAPRREASDG